MSRSEVKSLIMLRKLAWDVARAKVASATRPKKEKNCILELISKGGVLMVHGPISLVSFYSSTEVDLGSRRKVFDDENTHTKL